MFFIYSLTPKLSLQVSSSREHQNLTVKVGEFNLNENS